MNVLDSLKDKSVAEIKEHCDAKCFSAALAMRHVTGDFNLGTVIRNANFFGFKEVFYIGGSKQWDRRSAVGTHHYTDLIYCKTDEEFFEVIKDKYLPVALECNINVKSYLLPIYSWPDNPVIIFGEEQQGLPLEFLQRCYEVVTIPANGSVRSLNVGTASGIATYSYFRQMKAPEIAELCLKELNTTSPEPKTSIKQ